MVRVHFNTALQNVFCKGNAPATWLGVMSRNGRDYLAQAGSSTITTEVFPENKMMKLSFLSFTAKEHYQLMKR